MPSFSFPRLARLLSFPTAALLSAAPAVAQVDVPLPVDVVTYHNDAAITGQYPHETLLTPTSVNYGAFGKKFSTAVDGQVYAQPLYAAGVYINNRGRHNVVFVATEHDSLYAFDAETGGLLWHRAFAFTVAGKTVTSVPNSEVPGGCGQIQPELGITATPVLDASAGTIYVVPMTKEVITADGGSTTTNYYQRLHAIDISTGNDRPNSPATVEAAVPGTGDGGTTVTFVPLDYKERPGLVLLNGVVYTSWSSHCDITPYHGWEISYDAKTLKQIGVYNDTANGQEGSFWTAGAAPAVDASGNMFIGSANGAFNMQNTDGSMNPSGANLGESYLRLTTSGGHLAVADWFTPYNYDNLNDNDEDTGCAGNVLYDVGSNHLLATATKYGSIYVLNRDNLGHFTPNSDAGAVQAIAKGTGGVNGGVFGCPAFFQSTKKGPTLYITAIGDYGRAFILDPATGKINGGSTSQTTEKFGYPGSVPAISSLAGANGIAWMLDPGAVLRAYDADNLASEVYNSSQAANSRDALGSYEKFTAPIIAQSRVYAGTQDHLVGYGLLFPATPTDATSQVAITVNSTQSTDTGVTQQVMIRNTGTTALVGQVSLVVDGLGADAALGNAIATTSQTTPRASFYLNLALPGGKLAPGASTTAALKFVTASQTAPSYTTRVLAGPGAR